MTYQQSRKPIPQSVAIFGAGGRMGQAVADYLAYAAPHIALRLLSTSDRGAPALRKRFPSHDVHVANYLDRGSLEVALAGVEAIFVVTPSGLDERAAMSNLIDVVRQVGTVKHVVRIIGYAPDSLLADVPAELLQLGGDADQHYIARELLAASGLPITYLNVGASLMDNLLFAAEGVRQSGKLVWPYRHLPLIDVRDLGEAAARLFLSEDARHIGMFHTINNGCDNLTTPQVAATMSDVFRTPITNDMSWESFNGAYGAMLAARGGRATEAEYRFKFFEFENGWIWSLNDFAEKMLGRRPNTFRSWLLEHRDHFQPS